MKFVRLLLLVLALAGVAPTAGLACTCNVITAEQLMRGGGIVARVMVVAQDREETNFGYNLTSTAQVVQSFSGPFPSELIEIYSSRDSRSPCPNSQPRVPGIGQQRLLVLTPAPGEENGYWPKACSRHLLSSVEAWQFFDHYAGLREQGDGVWINIFDLRRVLQMGPGLAFLRIAFPEVEFVDADEVPPEILHPNIPIADLQEMYPDLEFTLSEEDRQSAYRPDQSRFIAYVRDGRVTGGMFR